MGQSFDCVGVTKKYWRSEVLNKVTVSFPTGVTALLGTNGAGKTTLLSIMATLTRPTSGQVKVAGYSLDTTAGVKEARQKIGFLPQSFEVIAGATVLENVEYSAWTHGVPASDASHMAERMLKEVGLLERRTIRARKLSGGQRQRLGIACAVVHRPSVILLDEPTVGIDPIQRIDIRGLITTLGKTATVVLSTHLIEDVADIAKRTVVLRDGRMVFDGYTRDLARGAQNTDGSGPDGKNLEEALMELMT